MLKPAFFRGEKKTVLAFLEFSDSGGNSKKIGLG